jgi:hypothetical protein
LPEVHDEEDGDAEDDEDFLDFLEDLDADERIAQTQANMAARRADEAWRQKMAARGQTAS